MNFSQRTINYDMEWLLRPQYLNAA